MLFRSEIERIDEKVRKKVNRLKLWALDIEIMINDANSPVTESALKQLCEAVRYSDPMSSDELIDLEIEIDSKIRELKESLMDDLKVHDLCNELKKLLLERNKKCIILK